MAPEESIKQLQKTIQDLKAQRSELNGRIQEKEELKKKIEEKLLEQGISPDNVKSALQEHEAIFNKSKQQLEQLIETTQKALKDVEDHVNNNKKHTG